MVKYQGKYSNLIKEVKQKLENSLNANIDEWNLDSNNIMETKTKAKLNLPDNSENQVINKVVDAVKKTGWDNGEIINDYSLNDKLDNEFYYNSIIDEMKSNNIQLANTYEGIRNQIIEYIFDNMDNKNSIAFKIIDDIYRDSAEYTLRNIKNELIDNNIYREINTKMSIDELIQHLKKYGTGNCWAKKYNKAESYNSGYVGTPYIFIGKATDKNISWYDSILLRMINEDENEIRLKNNVPVQITKIINKNTKKRYNVNQVFSTGDKYSYAVLFKESKQTISENKLDEIKQDFLYLKSCDKILLTVFPETYDISLTAIKQGQKPETFDYSFYKDRPKFMNLLRHLLARFNKGPVKGTDEIIKRRADSINQKEISMEAVKAIFNSYYGKIKVSV